MNTLTIRDAYSTMKMQQIVALGHKPSTALFIHKKHWDTCYKCDLGACAQHKVLFRGHIPCDILFIGEPPDDCSDPLGRPYANCELFDEMLIQILEYCAQNEKYPDWCVTPSVACRPRSGEKPTTPQLLACNPRLVSFIQICEPKLVVIIGDQAKQIASQLTNRSTSNPAVLTTPIRTIKGFDWMSKQHSPALESRKAALLLAPLLVRLMEQTDVSAGTR